MALHAEAPKHTPPQTPAWIPPRLCPKARFRETPAQVQVSFLTPFRGTPPEITEQASTRKHRPQMPHHATPWQKPHKAMDHTAQAPTFRISRTDKPTAPPARSPTVGPIMHRFWCLTGPTCQRDLPLCPHPRWGAWAALAGRGGGSLVKQAGTTPLKSLFSHFLFDRLRYQFQ